MDHAGGGIRSNGSRGTVYLLGDKIADLGVGSSSTVVHLLGCRDINNVCVSRFVTRIVIGAVSNEVSIGPAFGFSINGVGQPLKKLFVLLEKLLILVQAVEHAILIHVAFCNIFCSITWNIAIV